MHLTSQHRDVCNAIALQHCRFLYAMNVHHVSKIAKKTMENIKASNYSICFYTSKKIMVLVRKRPPLVGEVSVNFSG
jgi:hypothetical protein